MKQTKVFTKFKRISGTSHASLISDTGVESNNTTMYADQNELKSRKHIGNSYIQKRDERSNKRGAVVNKLNTRIDANFKSVKRSAAVQNRDIASPGIQTREQQNDGNVDQLRNIRVLKNNETDLLKQDEYTESNPVQVPKPETKISSIYGFRSKNYGTISKQLEQQRWKSTLHGRPIMNPYKPVTNPASTAVPINQPGNSSNLRSRSFQPSVIRRREGNTLKKVDVQNEMLQNIKMRRESENQKTQPAQNEILKGNPPVDMPQQRAIKLHTNNKRNNQGVKKIILKQNVTKKEEM